jgi:DnaK suppressor protein
MPKTKSTTTKGSARTKATKKEDTSKKKKASAGKTAGRKAASAPKKSATAKSTAAKKKTAARAAEKKAAPKKPSSRSTAKKTAPAKKAAAKKAASTKKTTKAAKKTAEKKSTAKTAKKKAAPKGAATGAKKKQMAKKTTAKKPAAKKSGGKASFKDEIKKTLLEAKQRILNEVSQKIKSESNVLKFEIGDIYDIASSERERELALTLGDRDRQKLSEIEEALDRLSDDTYGECEECGEPIEQGRLKALPFTRVCVECQSRHEREQRIRGRFEEEAPGLGGMVEKSDSDEDEF